MTLPRPHTEAAAAGLAALLADPAHCLVSVDFDGTLAPIVHRPEDARPVEGALAALHAVAGAFGHVAIVTGRPADWLVEATGVADVPGLVISGQYGAQHWAGGTLTESEPAPGLAAVREALPGLVAGTPARIEDKRLSLVVHTRAAEHPDAALAALVGPLRALAAAHGLEAHPGRAIVELRPAGFDKGGALTALVTELGARSVLFAGDDLGDLAAFAAVRALRADGVPGVTVCSASAEVPAVAERADLVVDGPPGVVALLTALVAAAAR